MVVGWFRQFRAWRQRRRVERGERAYQMQLEMAREEHHRDAVTEPLTGNPGSAVSGLSGSNQGGDGG
jgi:hypothetical protein